MCVYIHVRVPSRVEVAWVEERLGDQLEHVAPRVLVDEPP